MSDETIFEDITTDVHDIFATIEHSETLIEKRNAARKALEARRRIEALQEERELAKRLADVEFDLDNL